MAGRRWDGGGKFLKVRIGRKFYWIGIAGFGLASIVLNHFMPTSSNSVGFVPMFLLYAWRLHDIGKSAWWAALVFAVEGAIGIFAAVACYPTVSHYFGRNPEQFPEPSNHDKMVLGIILATGLLIQLAFTIWLGVKKGDLGQNRFGWRYGDVIPREAPKAFS